MFVTQDGYRFPKQTIPGRRMCRSHKSDKLHRRIFRPNQFTNDGHFAMYLSIHPSFPSCRVVCFCFLPYFISTTSSCTCLLTLTRLAMRTQYYHSASVYKRCQHIPITINDKVVPHSNTEKYLGMTMDAKLRWKTHVKKKREELGLKCKKMYWLMGRR